MASPSLNFAIRCLIEWFIALALWLCFTFSLSAAEFLIGAACATLTVIAFELVLRAQPFCFRPTPAMLGQIVKLPGLILNGLAALLIVLWNRMRGAPGESLFRLVPFRATGSTPKEAAQRALVTSFSTTPPNSIVVGIDRNRQQILLHQVKKTAPPEVIRNLEAAK